MSRREKDRDFGAEGERAFQGEVDAHFAARAEHWQVVYEERNLWSVVLQHRRRQVLAWVDGVGLARRSRVLDVGCGPGAIALELARRGLLVYAIDRAAPMAHRARVNAERGGMNETLFVGIGDTHALSFQDGAFSLLIAVGVIPWVHSPVRAVQEMARVLRPGGYLIIQASNSAPMSDLVDHLFAQPLAVFRTVRMLLWRRLGLGDYVGTRLRMNKHARDDFDRLLSAATLEKVEATTFGFRPFTLVGHSLVPFRLGVMLHNQLQSLADRGVPGVRWSGEQYLVLARKPINEGSEEQEPPA